MRFSAEWWTVVGLVFAAFGALTVMFCWWMDRRIARFAAENAAEQERGEPGVGALRDDYARAEGIVADGEDGLAAEIDRVLRSGDLDQPRSVS